MYPTSKNDCVGFYPIDLESKTPTEIQRLSVKDNLVSIVSGIKRMLLNNFSQFNSFSGSPFRFDAQHKLVLLPEIYHSKIIIGQPFTGSIV